MSNPSANAWFCLENHIRIRPLLTHTTTFLVQPACVSQILLTPLTALNVSSPRPSPQALHSTAAKIPIGRMTTPFHAWNISVTPNVTQSKIQSLWNVLQGVCPLTVIVSSITLPLASSSSLVLKHSRAKFLLWVFAPGVPQPGMLSPMVPADRLPLHSSGFSQRVISVKPSLAT